MCMETHITEPIPAHPDHVINWRHLSGIYPGNHFEITIRSGMLSANFPFVNGKAWHSLECFDIECIELTQATIFEECQIENFISLLYVG